MNRQTILAAIHRQLRENLAETGEVRPLGEIVGSVADEIRASRNGQVTSSVIRIETVAAFVDGNLSSAESEAVCQAVMVDNSVLAELVSAVRSIQQPADSLDPLPDVLNAQLMAMRASLPDQSVVDEAVEDLPIAEESAAPTIRTEPVVRRSQQHKRGQRFTPLIALVSIAAALAAIIFVATRDHKPDPQQPQIVQHEPSSEPTESVAAEPLIDSDVRVAESADQPHPSPEPVTPTIVPDLNPSPVVVQQDPPVLRGHPPTVESMLPAGDANPPPSPTSVARVTPLSGLRWTKVTGVVTRRNQVAPTSQSRMAIWESVGAGTSAPIESTDGQVVLRTLPLSRAEATLQSGGRVVMAADSGIEVSPGDAATSARINLHHGDVALVDLPDGTLIRLIKAGHPLATLRWQTRASAILQHVAGGLEVHVRNGTIDVNDQPQKNSSVEIARNRTVQSIPQPKRQPAWVDRPVETINVKQAFLAQIGDSRDVMGTINEQIRSLAQNPRASESDRRTLATLATWQAALAGEHVFRLARHPLPAVRMAALNRIIMVPRWDPRHQRMWTAIELAARDKPRAARFRRMVFMARQNEARNAAQINSLLEDLTAPDIASRAMSDFLLRRFASNATKQPPNFDPTWTGQRLTTAANMWRRYLGRSANALEQVPPAAAVDRLRN